MGTEREERQILTAGVISNTNSNCIAKSVDMKNFTVGESCIFLKIGSQAAEYLCIVCISNVLSLYQIVVGDYALTVQKSVTITAEGAAYW